MEWSHRLTKKHSNKNEKSVFKCLNREKKDENSEFQFCIYTKTQFWRRVWAQPTRLENWRDTVGFVVPDNSELTPQDVALFIT
jgi:hypothetical protein